MKAEVFVIESIPNPPTPRPEGRRAEGWGGRRGTNALVVAFLIAVACFGALVGWRLAFQYMASQFDSSYLELMMCWLQPGHGI